MDDGSNTPLGEDVATLFWPQQGCRPQIHRSRVIENRNASESLVHYQVFAFFAFA